MSELVDKVEKILRRHDAEAQRFQLAEAAHQATAVVWREAVERCAAYAESMSFDDAPTIAAGIRILATAEPGDPA